MSALEQAWVEFLANVDETPPSKEVLSLCAKYLAELSIVCPQGLVGVLESELTEEPSCPQGIPAKALLRRTVRMVAKSAQAKEGMGSAVLANPDGKDAGGLDAKALADTLAPTKKVVVDVTARLENAKLADVPHHMQVDYSVWQTMWQDTCSARATSPPRQALTFVDLTSKEVMPLWLPPDAVGGKSATTGDDDVLDPTANSSSLGKLAVALKGATASPRFFRTVGQWTAAFLRFGITAVSTEQWTMSEVLTHIDTITQIADRERTGGGSPLLALLYDDLLRRSWSARVERGDPCFKLCEAVVEQDKQVMAAARTRFDGVMKAAGLTEPPRAPGGADHKATELESYVAKQQAAMNDLAKKATEATKGLQRMQDRAHAATAAAAKAQAAPQGNPKGGKPEGNARDRKRKAWFEGKGSGKYGKYGGGSGR